MSSEIWYTFCPVLSASHIAVEKGWLQQEFAEVGVKISHISTLPAKEQQAHFSHRHPRLIRDGGNIPAIWAKSEGADTKVIGITWAEGGQAILVRKDSPIKSVADLKGARVILPRRPSNLIDFRLARAKRGIIMSLKAHGLTPEDVQFVDLPIDTPDLPGIGIDPKTGWRCEQQPEVDALQRGEAEAMLSYRGVENEIEQMGLAKIIYNLDKHPDWKYRVTNDYPVVCTISTEVAREHPRLVTRWMKVWVRAGIWAKENYEGVMRIMPKAVQVSKEAFLKSYPADFHKHLVPEISSRGIEALEIQKKFLMQHGFIQNDFDVKAWMDKSFLDQAWEELKAEGKLKTRGERI